MAKSLFIASGSQSAINAGVTSYSTIQGSNSQNSTESTRQLAIRPAGTFSNLRAYILYNTLSASSTIRFRKNTANGNQSITVGSGATGYFTDVSAGTDTVAAGDVINYQVVAGGTGTSMTFSQLSTVFTPTSSAITSTMYACIDLSDIAVASATYYVALQGYSTVSPSIESSTQCYVRITGSLKYLQARVSSNARTTTTTFRSRINTADGAQSFTVGSGATGLFQDTTNSDAVESGDLINMSWTTGTGTEALTATAVAMSLETSTKESMYCAWQPNGVSTSPGTTYKMPIHSKLTANSATTYVAKADFDGSFHKIGYLIMENTHTTASTGKIAINGTESTELAATITAGTTGWFNDLTGTEVMSSGDTINFLLIIGTGGDAAIRGAYIHFTQLDSLNDPVNTFVTKFTKDSTGTNGATQEVILPFTPKAIIVFSHGGTGVGANYAHYNWIQGFSDGTNHACLSITSDDADSPSDTAQYYTDDNIYARMFETNNAGIAESATCSFGTNKVIFTWGANSITSTWITLVAFGGSDITNVKVNTVDVNTTSTGTVNYTGLGFNPVADHAAIFTLATDRTAVDSTSSTTGSPVTGASMSYGCAASSSKQWTTVNCMEDAVNPSDTWRAHSTSNCIFSLTNTTGALAHSAAFSAWITDGFQLNWTDAPSNSAYKFSYLVINGGNWDVGNATAPSTTASYVDHPVSVNSSPIRGLLVSSVALATLDTPTENAFMSVGANSGQTGSAMGMSDEDNLATTNSTRYTTTSSTNSTLLNVMGVNGTDVTFMSFILFSTNNFQTHYSDVTGTNEKIGWVVVADYGEPPIPDFYAQISEPLVKYYNSIYVRKFPA